ncbi:MAG: TonB-dependent receptor [Coprobacter sp.]|nr:TonB-dependent receptor [Coprobacter sp.]
MFATVQSMAKTHPTLSDTVSIEQVVVTANKALVNKNNIPLSISVITREEIEKSSESALLPVLSQRVPGLFVTQKGITGFGVSNGGAGAVNIRGVGGGNKVLMLFDGQPQWAGVFGHSLPDTYVASDVDRVEVIRGPGSLLYGSNAMGGVVNIITRSQHTEGVSTQARIMYGSFNTQKYMINNGVRKGKFNSFFSINHDRTDGHRPNSQFNITNGFGKLGYEINTHLSLTGDVSLAYYDTHNPGTVTEPIYHNWMKIWRGTASASLSNRFDKYKGAVQLFYNWGNHKIDDGQDAPDIPSTYYFRSKDFNYGILAYESFFLLPGNQFTIGVDYKNWGGRAWNDNFDGTESPIIDKNVHEIAGYAIMQQELWNILNLNAGVRYEHNSTFGNEWVPQVGFTVSPFSGNTIKASLSKGFRSPNIRELYMYMPANPDLKPESMLNYEVSVGQQFLGGKMHAEITAFYIDGKNTILTIVQNGKRKNANSGRFYNSGVEFDFCYKILKNLNFNANYSYLHMNKPLTGAPEHKLFGSVDYTPGRWSFTLNAQSIFNLYVTTQPVDKEDYTLLNARMAYRFGNDKRNLTLFVKGENLTNTAYTINEGFPMPGIIAMGGIDVKF